MQPDPQLPGAAGTACFSSAFLSPELGPRGAAEARRRAAGPQEDLAHDSEEAGRGFFLAGATASCNARALPSQGELELATLLLLFGAQTLLFRVAAALCQDWGGVPLLGEGPAGFCAWGQPAIAHLLASLASRRGFLQDDSQNQAGSSRLHTSASLPAAPLCHPSWAARVEGSLGKGCGAGGRHAQCRGCRGGGR